jgi:hypothetical protein
MDRAMNSDTPGLLIRAIPQAARINRRRICLLFVLQLLFPTYLLIGQRATFTVTLYDVHAHAFVPGIEVSAMPLGPDNQAMGYNPADPFSTPLNLGISARTDVTGRAVFEANELLEVVDRVDREIAASPRKRLTQHYEVELWVLAKGYQCSPGTENLHAILEKGVVEGILAPPCKKSGVKSEAFHAKPGEIVVFVSHAK